MKNRILIIEDHEDVYENLKRKIFFEFPNFPISIFDNCDDAFNQIKSLKNEIAFIILDLTFKYIKPYALIKNGKNLLKELKNAQINIPTIIYTSHDEMEHIYPVINNYEPNGYVIKSNSSNKELLLAINNVLKEKKYFSHIVHELMLKRTKYAFTLDEVDEQIIKILPNAVNMIDWKGRIFKDNVAISYKSIKSRIDMLCNKFEVENEKQLLLKLQKLAIL